MGRFPLGAWVGLAALLVSPLPLAQSLAPPPPSPGAHPKPATPAPRPAWRQQAFDAVDPGAALEAYGGPGAVAAVTSGDIRITTPELAENGGHVVVEVAVGRNDVRSLAILVEKAPHPLAAVLDFPPASPGSAELMPYVRLPLQIPVSSKVQVVVQTNQGYLQGSQAIRVPLGDFAGETPWQSTQPAPGKTRLRLLPWKDVVEVHSLISAPPGDTPPPAFLQALVLAVNGRVVLDAQYGPGFARNPFQTWRLKGLPASSRVTLDWVSSQGQRGDATATQP